MIIVSKCVRSAIFFYAISRNLFLTLRVSAGFFKDKYHRIKGVSHHQSHRFKVCRLCNFLLCYPITFSLPKSKPMFTEYSKADFQFMVISISASLLITNIRSQTVIQNEWMLIFWWFISLNNFYSDRLFFWTVSFIPNSDFFKWIFLQKVISPISSLWKFFGGK